MSSGDKSFAAGDEDKKESSHLSLENVQNNRTNHQETTKNTANNRTNNENNGPADPLKDGCHIVHINGKGECSDCSPKQETNHTELTVELDHDDQISYDNSICQPNTSDKADPLKDGCHIVHINEKGERSDCSPKQENNHTDLTVELDHDDQISYDNSICQPNTSDKETSLEVSIGNACVHRSDADSSHHESEDNHSNNHISHQSCSRSHNNSDNSPEPSNDIQESPGTNVPNLQELTQSVTIGDDDKSNLLNERKDVSDIKVAFILLFLIVVVCSTIYYTLPKKRNKDWF